ncbi:MAG: deoxyribodipyrimidine photo-lyase, partial [Marinobacter sp.]
MPRLVWFRNDLRITDNPALTAACSHSEPVRALFVITPGQWRQHDWSPAKVQQLLEHLDDLGDRLAGLGIPLNIIDSKDFASAIDDI